MPLIQLNKDEMAVIHACVTYLSPEASKGIIGKATGINDDRLAVCYHKILSMMEGGNKKINVKQST